MGFGASGFSPLRATACSPAATVTRAPCAFSSTEPASAAMAIARPVESTLNFALRVSATAPSPSPSMRSTRSPSGA